jgi:hypothetical protein
VVLPQRRFSILLILLQPNKAASRLIMHAAHALARVGVSTIVTGGQYHSSQSRKI